MLNITRCSKSLFVFWIVLKVTLCDSGLNIEVYLFFTSSLLSQMILVLEKYLVGQIIWTLDLSTLIFNWYPSINYFRNLYHVHVFFISHANVLILTFNIWPLIHLAYEVKFGIYWKHKGGCDSHHWKVVLRPWLFKER